MRNESGNATVRLALGLLILAVGILFLLGNIGMINPRDYFRFWPSLLIILGLIQLFQPHRRGGYMFGSILVIVGAVLLLDRLHVIHFSFQDYWPLILIAAGILMVLNSSIFHRSSSTSPGGTDDSDAYVKASSILSGFSRKCVSRNFRGGDLTAVMGGFEIDLRDADMDSEAVVDVFLVMGGGELRVPEQWRVVVECLPILGGVEDKTHPQKDAKKRLVVRGTAIMGGMEIRN